MQHATRPPGGAGVEARASSLATTPDGTMADARRRWQAVTGDEYPSMRASAVFKSSSILAFSLSITSICHPEDGQPHTARLVESTNAQRVESAAGTCRHPTDGSQRLTRHNSSSWHHHPSKLSKHCSAFPGGVCIVDAQASALRVWLAVRGGQGLCGGRMSEGGGPGLRGPERANGPRPPCSRGGSTRGGAASA